MVSEGWHVPTLAEWIVLENCLGGASVSGGAMKEIGLTHLSDPNTAATNIGGFTGLPGGSHCLIYLCVVWRTEDTVCAKNEIGCVDQYHRFHDEVLKSPICDYFNR